MMFGDSRDLLAARPYLSLHALSTSPRPMLYNMEPLMCLHRWNNITWLFFSSALLVSPTVAQDLFLFSGQSNMLGHPTSSQAIETGRSLFEDTLQMEGVELINRLDGAQSNAVSLNGGYEPQIAERIAQAVSTLKEKGLLNGLLEPLPNAFCVWNNGALQPLEAYAGCGNEFGPELTFAHALQQQVPSLYATPERQLHVRKAAVGGKPVAEFIPGGDTHQLLLNVLDGGSSSGIYRAFVWYQGENDFFEETSTQDYVLNFMSIVDIITTRMFQHGATASAFAASTEIPVIVVKLGYWPGPGTPERTSIDEAHESVIAQLVSQGRPAALVEGLDQYSRFFHLDPATYLIAGDSIAEKFLALSPVFPSPPAVPCGLFCLIGRFFEWLFSLFRF